MGKKVIIKTNGDKKLALCNRCYAIICYVKCDENNNCVIIESNSNEVEFYTPSKIGSDIPIYCDKCLDLLTNTCLNE